MSREHRDSSRFAFWKTPTSHNSHGFVTPFVPHVCIKYTESCKPESEDVAFPTWGCKRASNSEWQGVSAILHRCWTIICISHRPRAYISASRLRQTTRRLGHSDRPNINASLSSLQRSLLVQSGRNKLLVLIDKTWTEENLLAHRNAHDTQKPCANGRRKAKHRYGVRDESRAG